MLDEATVERRLVALEAAVANLERRVQPAADDWLKKVIGSVRDIKTFDEALAYGKAYRQSDRPPDDTSGQS
jgi:hypothetical protein